MIDAIDAVVLAGLFGLGCFAIHALRHHAKRVTPVLSLIALCLGPFTILVALAMQRAPTTRGGGGIPPTPAHATGGGGRSEPSATSSLRLAQARNRTRQGEMPPTTDGTGPLGGSLRAPARTGLPEQGTRPDGSGKTPRSPASEHADRIE